MLLFTSAVGAKGRCPLESRQRALPSGLPQFFREKIE